MSLASNNVANSCKNPNTNLAVPFEIWGTLNPAINLCKTQTSAILHLAAADWLHLHRRYAQPPAQRALLNAADAAIAI